ncbi:unnamed protein product, partial [Prorocentrum cordatum]
MADDSIGWDEPSWHDCLDGTEEALAEDEGDDDPEPILWVTAMDDDDDDEQTDAVDVPMQPADETESPSRRSFLTPSTRAPRMPRSSSWTTIARRAPWCTLCLSLAARAVEQVQLWCGRRLEVMGRPWPKVPTLHAAQCSPGAPKGSEKLGTPRGT